MTGFKDPIEQRKVEKIEENIQMNVVAKKSLSDLTTIYMQDFFKFSKDMAESFRWSTVQSNYNACRYWIFLIILLVQ